MHFLFDLKKLLFKEKGLLYINLKSVHIAEVKLDYIVLPKAFNMKIKLTLTVGIYLTLCYLRLSLMCAKGA